MKKKQPPRPVVIVPIGMTGKELDRIKKYNPEQYREMCNQKLKLNP